SNGGLVTDGGVVFGNSTDCHGGATAVVWNDGVPTALNSLAAPSPLHMTDIEGINGAGQIIGEGRMPDGNSHDFQLTPTGSLPGQHLYVSCRLRNQAGTLVAWRRFCEHWRTKAGGRCSRH